MTRTTTKAILLALFSLLAGACGDPGNAAFDEELDVQEEPGGEEVGFEDEPAAVALDAPEDPALVELTGEEPTVIAEPDAREALVEAIVNGDVVIEEIGNGLIVVDGLSETEIAELQARGFDVQIVNEPPNQVVEARISIDLTRLALGGSLDSSSQGCDEGLLLEVQARTISQTGECGFVEYTLDATIDDDGRVHGVIRIAHGGATVRIDVEGLLEGKQLTVQFARDTLFPPGFRDLWQGTLRAELN